MFGGGCKCTAVVLDAHVNLRIDQVRRDVDGLLSVDGHLSVLGSVVGGPRSHPQLVLFVERRHGGGWSCRMSRNTVTKEWQSGKDHLNNDGGMFSHSTLAAVEMTWVAFFDRGLWVSAGKPRSTPAS